MPDQDKKLKSTEKATDKKPHGISMRDYSKKASVSLKCPVKEPTAMYIESGQTNMTRTWQNVKSNEQKSNGQWQESTEAVELEKLSVTYKNERNFSKHPKHQLFQDIFTTLVKDRLTCKSVYEIHNQEGGPFLLAFHEEARSMDNIPYCYNNTPFCGNYQQHLIISF